MNPFEQSEFLIDGTKELFPLEQENQVEENIQRSFCSECSHTGIFLSTGNSYIKANPCLCNTPNGHVEYSSEYKKIQQIASSIEAAFIPNRYLEAFSSHQISKDISQWYKEYSSGESSDNLLFLFGSVGTGKTYLSTHILMNLLIDRPDSKGLYIPYYKLNEFRKRYQDKRFKEDTFSDQYFGLNDSLELYDYIVIDEIGQKKISQSEQNDLFEIVDKRYSSKKLTILISNNCEDKSLSLDKVSLSNYVGNRLSSRINSGLTFHIQGADRRSKEKKHLISKKDKEEFQVPPKILAHDDNTHQIMTWLTRNPAFENISTKRRKKLTEEITDKNGEKIKVDLPRESTNLHEDVWVKGDRLILSGTVCDHEDKKVYAVALKELAKFHANGFRGLELKISVRENLRLLGLTPTGPNALALKRSYLRLNKMHLDYKSEKCPNWFGPLISWVVWPNEKRSHDKIHLSFNPTMILFYKIHQYTSFLANTSSSLKGDSSAFYLFYSSHNRKNMVISLEKCKSLLGIPEEFDKKEARKRVVKGLKNLIDAHVMEPEGTYIKNGKVFTSLSDQLCSD